MIVLVAIVFIHVLVRYSHYMGIVGADPQDDGIYALDMQSMSAGENTIVQVGTTLEHGEMVNPAMIFRLRFSYIAMGIASIRLIGASEFAFIFPAFISSIFCLGIVYVLGKRGGGEIAGLYSAAIFAFCPLDILYATRVTPDVLLAALAAAAFLAGEIGMERRTASAFLLGGIIAGLAHSIRPLGILIVPYAIFSAWMAGRWKFSAIALVGICLGHAPSALVYFVSTGDPLLDYHALKSAYESNYTLFRPEAVSLLPFVSVRYYDSAHLWYLKQLFSREYSLIFMMAVLVYGAFIGRYKPLVRRAAIFVIASVLLLEAAPVGGDFSDGGLALWAAPKHFRNLCLVMPLVAVVGGLAVTAVLTKRAYLYAGFIVIMIVHSLAFAREKRLEFIGPVASLRKVAALMDGTGQLPVYSDYIALGYFRLWAPRQRSQYRSFETFDEKPENEPAIAVYGGRRGMDVQQTYIEEITPASIKKWDLDGPPPGWKRVCRFQDGLTVMFFDPVAAP